MLIFDQSHHYLFKISFSFLSNSSTLISPSTFKKSLLKSQTKDDLLLKEDKESKETLVDKKPETEISVEELDKKLNEILNK